jgi:hypothetical protein
MAAGIALRKNRLPIAQSLRSAASSKRAQASFNLKI